MEESDYYYCSFWSHGEMGEWVSICRRERCSSGRWGRRVMSKVAWGNVLFQ